MIDDNPFYNPETDELLPNGNIRPKEMPKTISFGYREPGKPQHLDLWQYAADGDPEKTGKARTRRRPVNHIPRSRDELEKHGYSVNVVEKWITTRSGVRFKSDYLGLWDLEGIKSGKPRLLVQVCAKSDFAAHLRKMISDKLAADNRKPRLTNLLYCLDQGWNCCFLLWEKGNNGRYIATIVKITRQMIEEALSRRKVVKGKANSALLKNSDTNKEVRTA